MELSNEEILRYHRQIVLRNFDLDSQEKLKYSNVLIAGLGGLGCAASAYLASSGVGCLTLFDFDIVSLSNLQRQILHSDATIGMPKVTSAALQLAKINPYCKLELIDNQLNDRELALLIDRHDVVVDCTDNIDIREKINYLCFFYKIPLISGAAIRMEGQISVFTWKPNEPCYRCISRLFENQHLSCIENGIMAPLVGVIGAMQAMETLKIIAKFGTPANSCLLIYEAISAEFYSIQINRDKYCEVCGI